MFLRGSFPCVFFLAINVDRTEQYADLLRNLEAVYRRFCQEQGLARAFCANSALYAKPANALSSKVFSEVVDLASGDVVQLVRTLPCRSLYSISIVVSIGCGMVVQNALSPSGSLFSSLFSLPTALRNAVIPDVWPSQVVPMPLRY
jgi:hypothetical protein